MPYSDRIEHGDIITYTHTGKDYRKYWGIVIPMPPYQLPYLERPDEWIYVKWLGDPPHGGVNSVLNKNQNIVKRYK